jgi:hypothetical protein
MVIKMGDQEFSKVAILVLDDKLGSDGFSEQNFATAYSWLNRHLKNKYSPLRGTDDGITVLANEDVVRKRQSHLEQIGIRFLPNWQENPIYRELLREGLEQDKIYVMWGDIVPGFGYNLGKVTKDNLEITDPQGKIDIKPKQAHSQ